MQCISIEHVISGAAPSASLLGTGIPPFGCQIPAYYSGSLQGHVQELSPTVQFHTRPIVPPFSGPIELPNLCCQSIDFFLAIGNMFILTPSKPTKGR